MSSKNIPIYSIDRFNQTDHKHKPFQVEVFDANRHFEVQYPHRHDFFEVLFLTKGSGIHIIDNNQYDIKPPCIFFLSPGQAHKLELSKDVEGYIFLFTSEFYLLNKLNRNRLLELPFFFNIHQENPPLLLKNQNDVDFFASLFHKGSKIMRNNDEASIEVIHSLLGNEDDDENSQRWYKYMNEVSGSDPNIKQKVKTKAKSFIYNQSQQLLL